MQDILRLLLGTQLLISRLHVIFPWSYNNKAEKEDGKTCRSQTSRMVIFRLPVSVTVCLPVIYVVKDNPGSNSPNRVEISAKAVLELDE